MSLLLDIQVIISKRKYNFAYKNIWDRLHLDPQLFLAIISLLLISFIILYSSSEGNISTLYNHCTRVMLGFICMIIICQINPIQFKRWAAILFWAGIIMLVGVKIIGYVGKGAQRWIDLGFVKFQPSEIMKYAVPIMLAQQLSKRSLPINLADCCWLSFFILLPCFLIFKQPDLGTAILVLCSGITMFILAGLSLKIIVYSSIFSIILTPAFWFLLHEYQKSRVLTFLNPDRDPFGAGYHIIQSKIAIGSGGLFGKGWLKGSQTHLQYLPESSTDFIFALAAEEFGLIGTIIIITIYGFITARTLYLSQYCNDNFSRLLTGTLGITFFLYVIINIGMVSGIFPVVGIPLPLISYGGTSIITTMICFGIIMALNSERKLAHSNH